MSVTTTSKRMYFIKPFYRLLGFWIHSINFYFNIFSDDDESVGTSGDEADEKEFQALLERQLIVEKYEQGPEGQEVDPWENPDFELYKVTDRYGFVQ